MPRFEDNRERALGAADAQHVGPGLHCGALEKIFRDGFLALDEQASPDRP